MAAWIAWLGTALATHGFVVVAVNHPGTNALEDYTVEGLSLRWLRAVDLSAIIDAVVDDKTFGSQIDPAYRRRRSFARRLYRHRGRRRHHQSDAAQRVLPLARGRHAVQTAATSFQDAPKMLVRLSSDADFRQRYGKAGNSYRDGRIRAVFALAPGPGPIFTPESLGKISIPVAIVAESAEEIVPPAAAEAHANAIPHATLKLFPHAGHFVFLDSCTAVGRVFLQVACGDPERTDRDAVHAETIRLALDSSAPICAEQARQPGLARLLRRLARSGRRRWALASTWQYDEVL